MIYDPEELLLALSAIAFGVYLSLTASSFYHKHVNGFKALNAYMTLVLGIMVAARVLNDNIIPITYTRVLIYLGIILSAFTVYKAMQKMEHS